MQLRSRGLRPRPVRYHPDHVPPLTVGEIGHGRVRGAPLVPDHDGPGLPPDAAAKVEAADVLVQEPQQGLGLFGQKPLDGPRHGRVHKQRRLAGDRVPGDERVRGADGLAQGALGAQAGDLAGGGGRVREAQGRQHAAVRRGQGGVGVGEGCECRVAAAGRGPLEDPEEGGRGDVGRECLVDVPEIIGRARTEEGPQIAAGRGRNVRFKLAKGLGSRGSREENRERE